ncbi:MAG: hypothetical protein ACHP7C_09215, partial [Lysobacterales bacterium]
FIAGEVRGFFVGAHLVRDAFLSSRESIAHKVRSYRNRWLSVLGRQRVHHLVVVTVDADEQGRDA